MSPRGRRVRRQGAEGEFIGDPGQGFGGLFSVARSLRGFSQAHQHFVGRRRLGLREAIVNGHGRFLIVEGLITFRFAKGGRFDQIPDRRLRGECPACSVTMLCATQLDSDETPDVWTVSTVERAGSQGEKIAGGIAWCDVDDVAL